MSTRVAIALGAIAVLGLVIARADRRKPEQAEPQPREAPTNAETRDEFDVLIQALETGTCEWISAPIRLGNRLAVTIGNGVTHSYMFSPSDDRLTKLRQAVDRNHVLAPQGHRAD
jgi:hypothetical protein